MFDARTGRVVDVPVPDQGTPRRRGRARRLRRTPARCVYAAAACSRARRSRQERPSSGARTAGSGSSSNGAVRLEELLRDDLAALDGDDRSLGQLALAKLDRRRSSRRARARSRRSEEELVLALADPERTAQAAGEHQLRAAFVEPGRRHRAVELLSASAVRPRESSASAKMISESTVISGSARSIRCCAKSSSSFLMIPLWIPTTEPWRIGWLFA